MKQGDAAAAALDGADAARAQGADAGADVAPVVRVRNADGPAAASDRCLSCVVPGPGARPGRPRSADVPGADRARRVRTVGRRRGRRFRTGQSEASRAAVAELPRAPTWRRDGLRRRRGGADLLRPRNSNVTRAIYRAHFDDRRRELLRARMETRMETCGQVEARPETDCPSRDSAPQQGIGGCAAPGGGARRGHTRDVAGLKPAAPMNRKARSCRPSASSAVARLPRADGSWKRSGNKRVVRSAAVSPGRPRSAGSRLPSYMARQRSRPGRRAAELAVRAHSVPSSAVAGCCSASWWSCRSRAPAASEASRP
jgi:hypothetical protein